MATDPKRIETTKFIELDAKDAPSDHIQWETSQLQADSETHLEDDAGVGGAAIIRMFEFAVNPEVFKQHSPTRQELFNSHYKGIEAMLWRDGMHILNEVNPKVTLNKKGTKYRIFVGAKPQKGHLLKETPRTLSQIAHPAL